VVIFDQRTYNSVKWHSTCIVRFMPDYTGNKHLCFVLGLNTKISQTRYPYQIGRRSQQTTYISFLRPQYNLFWHLLSVQCNFLLVRNSNRGPIVHRFRVMTAFMCSWPHPYSTLILGCSRCTRSPKCWASTRACALSYSAEKLFSKNSNLFENRT